MRLFSSILALGFLWRLYISWRTPIPSEDGVNYLWMAERFAEAEFALGLSEVFPPLLSLLTALPIAAGLDPFLSAQLVLCLGGTLAILPLARATELLVPGGGALGDGALALAHERNGEWVVTSVPRSRVTALRETPGLSGSALTFLGEPDDPALIVVRYTHRQKRAMENVRFVVEQELQGTGTVAQQRERPAPGVDPLQHRRAR